MATTAFQKILGDLSGNRNVKNLVSDFKKLSKEIRHKGTRLNVRFNSQKQKTMKQAQSQYKKILSMVGKSQKQLDREVDMALKLIKKSAADVEKNLQFYKKKAMNQSHKLDKVMKGQARKASKKKTSRKSTRKTSRKSA